MAPPAAERRRRLAGVADLLLRPTHERAELAFRLALICALTTMATEYYGTPEPALTAYIVFFLNRPERTTSLIFNLALVVLITIVIAILFPLAILVVDAPAWRVATMALASLFFLFLASASKLRPVGAILALIIAYALDVLGSIPLGEFATRALLYAWLFIAIPAGVSLIVNLLIAPAPRRLAERGIAERLRAAAAILLGASESEAKIFARFREDGVGGILQRLHLARIERTIPQDIEPHLKAAAHGTATLLLLVEAIRDEPAVPVGWRREAAATLIEMANVFDSGGYPTGIEAPSDTLPRARSQRARILRRDFADVLAHFADTIEESATPEAAKSGFFLPDAFTNPEHLHYALKTTAAAMVCYFLYVLLDWPGIHTCLITCYIVALGTTAETVEKLGLRILGCLAGAAIGTAAIVWVIPAIDSIWAFLAVVFAGAFCGAWIAAGSARIAYAGFQFAFAFFLCVIQGTGPAFDLTIARDRIIGILIGNAVVYLVFTQLWPVSVSQRIERGFGSLLDAIAALARMPLPARRIRASAVQGQVSAIREDLSLVPYEPRAVRPPTEWAAARQAALSAVAELEQPILLDGDARFWTPLADRLDRLVANLPGGDASSELPQQAASQPPPWANRDQRRAREQMLILEQSLAVRT